MPGVGLGQRGAGPDAGVALVLGGGNIFSMAPLDTLQQLFAANRAVVLKLNPVTEPLHPLLERIFAPFIGIGAVAIVTGDGRFGGALADHPGVAAVHMTGSEATHDAIVWGTGEEAAANRRAGTPRLHKPITSELGGRVPGHRGTRRMVRRQTWSFRPSTSRPSGCTTADTTASPARS